MVEKAQKEVEVMIKEEGEAAVLEVGVHGDVYKRQSMDRSRAVTMDKSLREE